VPTSRELLETLLRLSITNDVAQVDLYADDADHELVFSPTGSPIRMTPDQMRAALTAPGPDRLTGRSLVRADIFESADGATAVAEYEFAGTLAASGEAVSFPGVMVVSTRDGHIAHSRNYLDPAALRRMNTPVS
jgi:ketosteroid isomerase-like protein